MNNQNLQEHAYRVEFNKFRTTCPHRKRRNRDRWIGYYYCKWQRDGSDKPIDGFDNCDRISCSFYESSRSARQSGLSFAGIGSLRGE